MNLKKCNYFSLSTLTIAGPKKIGLVVVVKDSALFIQKLFSCFQKSKIGLNFGSQKERTLFLENDFHDFLLILLF